MTSDKRAYDEIDNEGLAEFSDRQSLHYVRFFPVEVAKAWRAVTTSEYLNVWLYPVSKVEPKLGGRCSFTWGAPDDPTVECRVSLFEPNKVVRYETPAGYIQFDLVPVEGGTRFTFTQYFDPEFRQNESDFPSDEPGSESPLGPESPWKPGMVAGYHLNFRLLEEFLAEDWPDERVAAESERVVKLANTRGQDAFQEDPDGSWLRLIGVYTAHLRETFPAK